MASAFSECVSIGVFPSGGSCNLLNYLTCFLCSSHRKLKEVHKRLNELRELVQYYEQTSDMMVDAVNENVKDDDEEEEEEETEDGSMFETMFQSEQDNRHAVTNIRCVDPRKSSRMRIQIHFFFTTKC